MIARYGASWRGIKPKVAAEQGAVGCLIYSDPADDGYTEEDVFPNGPMRPGQGVQRGSVADMPMYPGDPLTPGVGATEDAKRLPTAEAPTLTKIPVLPISYGDAQPAARGADGAGRACGVARRASIYVSLRSGSRQGAPQARVQLGPEATVRRHRAAARHDVADEWIIRGNHHDAWVNGAEDPDRAAGGRCSRKLAR